MTNSPDQPGDEPSLSDEEGVEHGGELIRAVDFTPGGAPIGLTSKEFRRLNAELEHRAGWARAKALLAWAVLLPDRRATTEDCRRWVREVIVLGQLAREQLSFRVPAALGAFPDGDHAAIIRRFKVLAGRNHPAREVLRGAHETVLIGTLSQA